MLLTTYIVLVFKSVKHLIMNDILDLIFTKVVYLFKIPSEPLPSFESKYLPPHDVIEEEIVGGIERIDGNTLRRIWCCPRLNIYSQVLGTACNGRT